MRTEPAVSEPSAKSTSPAATAAAEPQLEPPGNRSGARGLTGVPCQMFSPVRPYASSTVLVFPASRAPACNNAVTTGAVALATPCVLAQSGLPQVVMAPATSNRSLTAKLRPESRPLPSGGRSRRGPGTKAPTKSSSATIYSVPAPGRTPRRSRFRVLTGPPTPGPGFAGKPYTDWGILPNGPSPSRTVFAGRGCRGRAQHCRLGLHRGKTARGRTRL
jgi:hypothetical protein